MSNTTFTESVVEEAALSWLEGLGFAVLHGPNVAPGDPGAERGSFEEVVFGPRQRPRVAA